MGTPYKPAHEKLVAAVAVAGKFGTGWADIAKGLGDLVTTTGFATQGQKTPDLIRAKITPGGGEAAVLRTGAGAPATATGADAVAGHARALALKTVRHLYLKQSFARQKVWVLSLPKDLGNFPMDFQGSSASLVDQVLNMGDEKFSVQMMSDLSDACQTALEWVQKSMVVAGSPLTLESRKLFRRWFVPAGTKDEDKKITAFASKLLPHLQNIATGLKTGQIILTDSPYERKSNSDLEKSEAFVFTRDDLIVVYVESDFFSAKNTLTGKVNWARIIVHELTHAYAKTDDHAYSWQGLLPRDDDTFKTPNDLYVARAPKFKAVRALTHDQCTDNADSWAFFCADAGGALVERDRIQALGTRLYDIGSTPQEKPVENLLKQRAA